MRNEALTQVKVYKMLNSKLPNQWASGLAALCFAYNKYYEHDDSISPSERSACIAIAAKSVICTCHIIRKQGD